MQFYIKKPKECTEREINEFIQLVLVGKQVASKGLKKRILNTKLLAFCYIDKELIGISSIKRPVLIYKINTFKKALVEKESLKYNYELGYTVTKAGFEGNGISFKVNSKLISHITDSGVYATTANPVMIHLLKKLDFKAIGEEYKGKYNDKIGIFSLLFD